MESQFQRGYQSYRDLEVWQRAMQLAEHIYALTSHFPPSERFTLSDQLRRAAISIPANIAEGHGRGGPTFRHFLNVALGSAAEVDTLLELAYRLGYVSESQYTALHGEVTLIRKMLYRLRQAIHSP